MSLEPKDEIKGLSPGVHGGIDFAEFKAADINPEEVLDFSVSANPFMPPPGIKKILASVAIERYPDSQSLELREVLAGMSGVAIDNLIVGSGTTELIRLIALAYFRKNDRILLLEPTFGDYEIACRTMGAKLVRCIAREEDGFAPHIEVVSEIIRKERPRAVFLCNPNNPTGQYVSREQVEEILNNLGGGLLVLDEAYIAFVAKSWNSLDLIKRGNVVILRSMTKDYGMCGLRLGYAVAPQDVIETLSRVCPPWNVNVAAQEVGVAVLGRADYLEKTKKKIMAAKQYLVREFTRLDYQV
ncbi:pyridoxal phosphate-dependent aminotransferase, partial [Chloroflexota bacterium]